MFSLLKSLTPKSSPKVRGEFFYFLRFLKLPLLRRGTLLIVFLILLPVHSNPWSEDPLAKLNLFPSSQTDLSNTKCNIQNTCSLCDIVEEIPLDLNGDDLAETAQRRQCAPTENNLMAEQVIIILSASGEPLIYKSNLNNCQTDKIITYTIFQRFDFNHDNFDELVFIEHDTKTDSDEIKILGFIPDKATIDELPLIEYETDLKDKFKGNLQNIKKSFIKTNSINGFIMSLLTETNQEFQIYYYQDAVDKAFYPLRIIEIPKKQILSIQAPIVLNPDIELLQ